MSKVNNDKDSEKLFLVLLTWKEQNMAFGSTPLFGSLVLSLLEEFHLMLFNSTGFWFVIQKFETIGGRLCL